MNYWSSEDGKVRLYEGDCLEVLPTLEECSIDTCITDPPYGLGFGGLSWDHGVPGKIFWEQVFRVLKPGSMLLSFGGTRTWHRLACAIEDAGFEIRDTIMWVYSSGFPKSHNIAVYVDRLLTEGKNRDIIRKGIGNLNGKFSEAVSGFKSQSKTHKIKTELGEKWAGWGTGLKPAYEPIILAMKPLEGNYSENAVKWEVAGLWIEGTKIPTAGEEVIINTWDDGCKPFGGGSGHPYTTRKESSGRWPANLIHDGNQEISELFPTDEYGSLSRVFYAAKVSRKEKELFGNNHPTVKPISLMNYLVRLTKTPFGGVVLDPFMGSGSTGVSCLKEGRRFVGIEINHDYFMVARKRLFWPASQDNFLDILK